MPSTGRKSGSSHLRQLSRVSLERPSDLQPRSPDTVSSTSTIKGDRPTSSRTARAERDRDRDRRYTVTVNESFARDDVLLNLGMIAGAAKPGSLMAIDVVRAETDKSVQNAQKQQHQDRGKDASSPSPGGPKGMETEKRYIFTVKDMPKDLKARYPNVEVYVAKSIADAFGMKKGSQVFLTPIDAANPAIEASHVELSFKEQYLSRADMWRMTVAELSDRTVYKGQMLLFLGTVKAQVTTVFVDGRKVQSAFFGPNTKPIFRSESGRYVLFIQMAREMWDFDADGSGEILFNKVVHGFLPTLFKKWSALNVRHIVSIVLFSRVEYDTGISTEFANAATQNDYYTGIQSSGDQRPYKDFYRVVVTEMSSYEWTKILSQLKRELNFFRRDISIYHQTAMGLSCTSEDGSEREVPLSRIKAEASRAMYGNFLEAINMASSLFAHDYIDRDLTRTGISIVVISPSPGVFEVDYDSLRRTTEALVGNGIGIDLICVPKVPLHSVPLFRYRNPQYLAHSRNKNKLVLSLGSTPRQTSTAYGSYNSASSSFSPGKGADTITLRADSTSSTHSRDEWCFALPTWLHVSYWTGTSEETLSYQGIALSVSETSQQRSDEEFMIRCRMYDLQMRSVMETNEIETAPLHTDRYFPRKALQPDPHSKLQLDQNGNIAIRTLKVPDTLFDHVYGFQKFAPDRYPKPGEKSIWKMLQEYDESRARLPTSRRSALYPRHNRDLDETTRRHILEDTGLLGTSYTERRSSVVGSHLLPVGSMISQRSTSERTEPSSSISSKLSSPTKAPKFMRHISLSTRGFGIAAPKAASAEVSIETANASRSMTPSRNTPDSSMTPKKKPSPSTLSPMPISTRSFASPNGGYSPSYIQEYQLAETPSRPIVIKNTLGPAESTNQFTAGSILPATLRPEIGSDLDLRYSNAIRADDAKKVYNSKLLAGALPELPSTLSPTSALSPWLTLVNPSNPNKNKIDMTSLYSRWEHVFPNTSEMRLMKWKTFCCPAAVPLTTEYFPTRAQFESEYQRQPYNVSRDADDDLVEEPASRDELMREMISLRFSQGFQVVVGPAVARAFGQKQLKVANIFSRDHMAEDGTSIFMSLGNTIHQLSCVNGNEVEVNIYVRRPSESHYVDDNYMYRPAIRTLLDTEYRIYKLEVAAPKTDRNWNYIDSFVAGHHDELTENLRFWRARYVLIPMSARHSSLSKSQAGDNEEEIRIEGIRKLAQLWLKHRYLPPDERQRYQSSGNRKKMDPNPLDIVYKTEDPSVVIAAELETLPLLEGLEGTHRKGQLVTSREQFQKKNFSLAALAEAMQQPIENGGIRTQNRRWHLRLHYNCFIGSDMTSWLLENFEDLEDREEAEDFGNRLMVSDEDRLKDKEKEAIREGKKDNGGLFVHVERRHPFRDGQYFYQFGGEHAKPHPPGWFNSRRRDISVPSTPLTETMPRDSLRTGLSRPTSIHEENSPASGATTPTAPAANIKKPKVVLSKVMKYDVDHRKRSYRPEVVDLHYDRLHNPDNCYHVRVDWMNVTAKLVEDAVETWARDALAYGLRLVELPIAEVCDISETNPFRRPYMVKLAVPPPTQQPETYYDPNSFGPQAAPGKYFYQKAILKKFDFVLDTEAASNFPCNVDVTYSWGKPNFRYSQYIHRTGMLICEITDDGDFLFLANLVYSNRAAAAREKEIQKETRSSEHATLERERVGASSRMGGGQVAGSYMPYGIAEPTPISSPTVKPAFFASPVVRPVHASRATPTLVSCEFGVPNLPQLKPSQGGLTPGITTPGLTTPGLATPGLATPGLATPGFPIASQPSGAEYTPLYNVIRDEIKAFCYDAPALEAFYRDLLERGVQPPPHSTPGFGAQAQPVSAVAEHNIPTLGLPPGVLAAASDMSASPRVGSPALMMSASQLLRRGSLQDVTVLGGRVGAGGTGGNSADREREKGGREVG